MAKLAEDLFNRADSNTLGSDWESRGSSTVNFQIISNQVAFRNNGVSYQYAFYSPTQISGTQYAQLTIIALAAAEYTPGPSIRATDSWSDGYSACVRSDGALRIVRAGSGVYDGSAGDFANGDVIRIEDRGSTNIVVMKNGVDFHTYTNAGNTLTGTWVGMYCYYWDAGSVMRIDSWSAGDLTSSASIAPLAAYYARPHGTLIHPSGFGRR
jgi:hypothetical protein